MATKDAYFFKHDSNARTDMKLVKVRRKYKMAGYGIYFGLLELLRDQAEHKLPVADIEDIAYEFNEPLEKVKAIINDFGLFKVENAFFFSEKFLERMSEYNAQKAKRIQAGSVGGKASAAKKSKQPPSKRSAKVEQSLTDAQAIDYTILDYIRVDYTTLNKTKELYAFAFDKFWELYGKAIDKKKSFEKFEKLELSELNLLFANVSQYVKSTPDVQFRKNPTTYLNGKCWNDLPIFSTVKTEKIFKPDDFHSYSQYLQYCEQNNIKPAA